MMQKKDRLFILYIVMLSALASLQMKAQSLPVGTPVLEDYYRRMQLLGKMDSSLSFTLRPLQPDSMINAGVKSENGKFKLAILPLIWQQQINSKVPYGWNDGAMVPAKGYQTMLSAGVFAKVGFLSIQLRPEYVYAENKDLGKYTDSDPLSYHNFFDWPERLGDKPYNKWFWGQSSIRLNFGPASLGLSNENLWWGPGKRNSLLMSNSAPGFKHITLNTIRPIKTGIGSFEGQAIGGKLENSGIYPSNLIANPLFKEEWRYLSALNLNYNPKWVPGLFLGFTRMFYAYHDDVKKFSDYVPFLTPFQKIKVSTFDDPFPRDQITSLYARWLFPKAHAEVYFEYGLNDNSYNFRDFMGSPDHSRTYIFGFSKLVPLKTGKDEFIEVNVEITQMSQSLDRIVRGAGDWYYHSWGVVHGYANMGQIVGAGTGPGGNLQSLDIAWVKRLKKLGLALERYEHINFNYYNNPDGINGLSRKWVDFAIAAQGSWDYKNLLFNVKLQTIRSLNYNWQLKGYDPNTNAYYIPNNGLYNFHGELGVTYRF